MEKLRVPSGAEFNGADLKLIKALKDAESIQWNAEKPFRLKSGITSPLYIKLRDELGRSPELRECIFYKVRKQIYYEHSGAKIPCLLGIPNAGTPIAITAATLSSAREPIRFRQVYVEKKSHGDFFGWTEEPPAEDEAYFTIDNVLTTGASFAKWLPRLAEDGYPVREMRHLAFIDRECGGVIRLQKNEYDIEAIYNLRDILYAGGKLGYWNDVVYQRA